MLQIGDAAPDFDAPVNGDAAIRLKDLRGKKVVLYFYPKDNTPGCTTEACDFRDSHAAFEDRNTVVLGVSPDGVRSHDKFVDKFSLPFRLVADEDHKIAEAYGVWQEKSMYGRKYMGIVRSTFVIDEKGKIAAVWQKVKVKQHAEAVLAALESA